MTPRPLLAQSTQKRVILVAGFGASTQIDDERFVEKRRKTFAGQHVSFFNNELYLNRDRVLKAIQQADIFFYSGHSGTPSSMPGFQVLLAKPTGGSDKGFVTAAQIRDALRGKIGPRLVIVNGCSTTDENDGVAEENRLSNGFGIKAGTEGRAYLGWSKSIPGFLADDQIGRLLDAWTAAGNPTIEEARQSVGIENLDILGDKGLRYR